MRQVLSWRFLAALLAVAGLGVGALALTRGNDGLGSVVGAAARPRRADLILNVAAIERSDFEMTDLGTVSGTLILDLPIADNVVRMQVFPGTPGEITCDDLDTPFQCAVIAELLGDSIVSFRLVPVGVGLSVELPAIVELEGGYARLTDGWEVPYAAVIDRSCDPDAASFSEFLADHGTTFTSVYNLAEGAIVAVGNCRRSDDAVETTSAVASAAPASTSG